MSRSKNGASLPFEGVRVIEMESFLARLLCGQLLADFGAEVINLEQPGKGATCGSGSVTLEERDGLREREII